MMTNKLIELLREASKKGGINMKKMGRPTKTQQQIKRKKDLERVVKILTREIEKM